MRLVLFSPALAASAIGGISAVLEAELLNRGHEVTIVRTETSPHTDAFPHAFESNLVRWDDEQRVDKLTRDADAIIYQIGNNYPYHCGSLEWLPKVRGVVLF